MTRRNTTPLPAAMAAGTNRFLAGPGAVFALVFLWKAALLAFLALPVPSNDSYFYDGPVVNLLWQGKYANPALAMALPISGTEMFCAYPPLYQALLLGWMSLFGTTAISAMTLHLALFGVYMLLLLGIFRQLRVPAGAGRVAGVFLLLITFHDRPDCLAHVFGVAAVYAWVRSHPSLAGEPRACRRWAWAMAGLAILSLATGLQIGALYCLLLGLGLLARRLVPFQPAAVPARRSSSRPEPAGQETAGPGLAAPAARPADTRPPVPDRLPYAPMLATAAVPAGLLALVIFGFPHIWAGFMEHARQTPSLTGWRLPVPDELLKVLRNAPGILAAAALLPWLCRTRTTAAVRNADPSSVVPRWAGRRMDIPVRPSGADAAPASGGARTFLSALAAPAASTRQAASLAGDTPGSPGPAGVTGPLWLVTLAATLATLGVVAASLFLLTPNSVLFVGQLQPLVVAGCLMLLAARWPARRQVRLQMWLFLVLAALGSIRAVGMTTWGAACSLDAGYRASVRRVQAELQRCAPGDTVVLSAAYLYAAAPHQELRCLHSDWIAPARRRQPRADAPALASLKPVRILLTQLDYYRRYQPVLAELQRRPDVATIVIVNTARVPAPDSFRPLQKVLQHISWAPVVVTITWQPRAP